MRTLSNSELSTIAGGDDAPLVDAGKAAADVGAAALLVGAVPVAVGCLAFAATIAIYEVL